MNRSPAPWLTSAGFSRQFAPATLRRQRERVRFASLSQFSLSYADGTRLGEYYAKTDYGCITQCNSPDFNGVDGIVGAAFETPRPRVPPF
jgi:hypothetical protein